MQDAPHFTWIPIQTEATQKLLTFSTDRAPLLKILSDMKTAGLKAIPVDDQNPPGTPVPLEDIDPFTFLASINRGLTKENRRELWSFLKSTWNLESEVPDDFHGIPIVNNQRAWFFEYKYNRKPSDIEKLWEFATKSHNGTQYIDDDLFQQVLAIKQVGLTKLTMGLFWICPDRYIALDAKNNPKLQKLGIDTSVKTWNDYTSLLQQYKNKTNTPIVEFSHGAHLDTLSAPNNSHQGSRGSRIWMIAPGENARLWEQWFSDGEISIGWDYLGDLREYSSREEIESKLQTTNSRSKRPTNTTLACWQFANDLQVGDWLIAKKGKKVVIGFGIVTSGYRFDSSRPEYHHVHSADWKLKGEWTIPHTRTVTKTLTDITPYPDYCAKILEAMEVEIPEFLATARSQATPVEEEASVYDSEQPSYYWLNANPKIWDFNKIEVGQKQAYTTHNENGNPRRIQKWFQAAKPGDLLVAYSTCPDKEIVGFAKITKSVHEGVEGESIEFEKTRTLSQPIPLETIKAIPELAKSEPLKGNQGSLFHLSSEEFDIILGLADERDELIASQTITPYTKEDALRELFLNEASLDRLSELLTRKKNLILQGPPGVGKSYLAKRLAFAIMGQKSEAQVTLIQFHQSYAYEDFIQGYRPNSDGGFSKQNGVFYEFCRKARSNLDQPYFFIIDEINRGNLSRIFGELMLLLEADKRSQSFAMPLTYSPDVEFFVPQNVHVIGMMNTADRSLAMVDYALRRRFAFVSLVPEFDSPKFSAELTSKGIPIELINRIQGRMNSLNKKIAEDTRDLGAGYCIGHSFFCPAETVTDPEAWFQQVVDSEIRPLLEEYWADDGKGKAEEHIRKLLSE